ncbi:hypothetical protein JXR93_10340 [bacterium]|nr:hypothetical protein [bacterium]
MLYLFFFIALFNNSFIGKAGHLATNLSIGSHLFTYQRNDTTKSVFYINKHSELFYFDKNDISMHVGLSFFASERHTYSFNIGGYIIVYPEFEKGEFNFEIVDSLWIKNWFLFNNGAMAIFKGNYEFAFHSGFTLLYSVDRDLYFGLENRLVLNFNNLSLEYLLSTTILYIF